MSLDGKEKRAFLLWLREWVGARRSKGTQSALSQQFPGAAWGQALPRGWVRGPLAVDSIDRSLRRLGADLAAKERDKKEVNEQGLGQACLLLAWGRGGGQWGGWEGGGRESPWPKAWPGEERQLLPLYCRRTRWL